MALLWCWKSLHVSGRKLLQAGSYLLFLHSTQEEQVISTYGLRRTSLSASGLSHKLCGSAGEKVTLNVKTYTNLDTSVTSGFHTTGGNLIVNGGEMFINGQQNFGAWITGGTNTFKGLKIDNTRVNHAGNNAITNGGGVLQFEGCKFVVPPLAKAIAAGGAVTVASYWSAASNTNDSNVTISPNAGYTVDPL